MTETAETLEGRCLCGAVMVAVQQTNRDVEVCHCSMCRNWSGGPLFCLHGLTDDAISVSGEEHVVRYQSSQWAERAFCGTCGSNLWYLFIPSGTRALLAGLFQLSEDYAVSQQIFVDERPHWAKLAADTPEKTSADIIAEAEAAGFTFD